MHFFKRKVALKTCCLYGLITVSFLYLLTGCGSQEVHATSPTKQEGRCPTGTSPQTTAQQARVQYAVAWDANAEDADNNRGTSTLHVTAFDTVTGHLLWQKEPTRITAMYQSSTQQVVDGVLYIASYSSNSSLLLAVDTKDGHKLWQRETNASMSFLGICSGKIYVSVDNRSANMQALRATDGKVLWTYTCPQNCLITPSIVSVRAETIYVTELVINSDQLFVTALNANDGKVSWRKEYQNKGDGSKFKVVATDQAVYAIRQIEQNPDAPESPTNNVAKVEALLPESGKVAWTTQMPAGLNPLQVVALDDRLYLSSGISNAYKPEARHLIALNARDGKILWQRAHEYDDFLLLPNHEIYGYKGYGPILSPKQPICALDAASGKDLWCQNNLQPSLFSLSTTGDSVIVVETIQDSPMTLNQNLVALSKRDGKVLWKQAWKSSSPSTVTLTLFTVTEGQNATLIPLD